MFGSLPYSHVKPWCEHDAPCAGAVVGQFGDGASLPLPPSLPGLSVTPPQAPRNKSAKTAVFMDDLFASRRPLGFAPEPEPKPEPKPESVLRSRPAKVCR